MIYHQFGSTGHRSSRALFGAAALWDVSQEEADRTLEILDQYGINHIDTAASYGKAEDRLGPWMEKRRGDFFLATKTEERTREGARRELERSLQRLRTDHVDLWQMHLLVDPEEWETAMGPGGALEALIQAREEGMVRYLGVTGHGLNTPAMHRKSLERYPFDSVLLPWNYPLAQHPQYAEAFQGLADLCRERGTAVQVIKTAARRLWGKQARRRNTWYEPLEELEDIDRAVHWALGFPRVFLNTAADTAILPRILDAVTRFSPSAVPPPEEMAAWSSRQGMERIFPNPED